MGVSQPVLAVRDLSVQLEGRAGTLNLLDRVALTVARGEVVAVVGETGSGKTLTGMAALGFFPARARVQGSVRVDGVELVPPTPQALAAVRGRRVAVVPQNPSTALNPVFTVGQQLGELLLTHRRLGSLRERREAALSLLREVELPRPAALLNAYPHELSGGMQQRVLIAMALACEPELVVADEPTTALDATTQAQILRLVLRLRAERGLALLWITHDLGVAAHLADRVVVLYAGKVMEDGPVAAVLGSPRHPYTRAVIDSLPGGGRRVRDIRSLPGDLPSPAALPAGCRFHPRCPMRFDPCAGTEPLLRLVGDGHAVACHRYDAPSTTAGGAPLP